MNIGDKVRYKVCYGFFKDGRAKTFTKEGVISAPAQSGGWIIRTKDDFISNRAEKDIEAIK